MSRVKKHTHTQAHTHLLFPSYICEESKETDSSGNSSWVKFKCSCVAFAANAVRQKQGENRKSFASALCSCQIAAGSLCILYTLLPLFLQTASFISLSAISSIRWVTSCQIPSLVHYFSPHLFSFPLQGTPPRTLQQMKPYSSLPESLIYTLKAPYKANSVGQPVKLDWTQEHVWI